MKSRIQNAALVVAAICCLWFAGGLGLALRDLRVQGRSNEDRELLPDAPPTVAMTAVILGGFRGIVADILWLRASHLQEAGRYFELVQLSSWITRLEPRFAEVWAFHAWNMAYNVSVMMPDEQDRWRWVSNAVALLRDEGLRYNGSDPRLYWELGWLHQHKIGGPTDRAHRYYKTRLATAVEVILPGSQQLAGLSSDGPAADALRETLGLGLDTMLEIEAAYGQLDWRIPETHAVYWAHLGLQAAGADGHQPCERMLIQCLSILFERGRLTSAPDNPVFGTAPNLDILPHVLRLHERAVNKYAGAGVKAGFRFFLVKAVSVLRREGRDTQARELFKRLRAEFPAGIEANYDAFDPEAYLEIAHTMETSK